MPRRLHWLLALQLFLPAAARADGPDDNRPEHVRRMPPPGLAIPDAARRELTDGVTLLGAEIAALRPAADGKPDRRALLADVEIFHKAVDWALRYDEFFKTNEVEAARAQLREGRARAAALREDRPYWSTARGLVVRGYVSRVDGSVQPYGLVVPATWEPAAARRHRLDFWFHGRGEQLSELAFLQDRMRNPGEFTPPDAFVLHLYGRYCNGSRFAGETDFWEAFEDVRRRYPVDEERLVVRGFSLGGASCWHMAVHHASRWAAAAPGAGFSETAEFLRVFQGEQLAPPVWEQKLWRLYDATAHALNVSMVPLVAYSGEDDRQIQAARAMETAMAAEGLRLAHLIGPKTGHRYEAGAKAELNARMDALAAQGRDPAPRRVRFVTYTLRYHRMAWVTVDGLERHWEPARVEAALDGASALGATTRNVTALTLAFEPGRCPFDPARPVRVTLDGTTVDAPAPASDRSWVLSAHREADRWVAGPAVGGGLRKRHGLQGPIDDAFMDSFIFVRPTGRPLNEPVGAWVTNEFAHAAEHWRRQFRGDARIKDDIAITEADLAAHHVVLWGDPQSNVLLARIADQLPIRWSAGGVRTPTAEYPAERCVPVLIQPNPLHPDRYVVVNSGFTFREYDYLNNARQTPKLPDWAIVDITQPPGARAPGGIAAAGFFGERWEWKDEL